MDNFPFEQIRPKQLDVLKQICEAFNQGYKTIVLEAPTGFGKSPVAVAVGKTLGSSYICSATKDLQAQYAKDFQFIQVVKGMREFPCLVKEDLISSELFKCSICGSDSQSVAECSHITTLYGPCRQDHHGYTHITNNACILAAAVDMAISMRVVGIGLLWRTMHRYHRQILLRNGPRNT